MIFLAWIVMGELPLFTLRHKVPVMRKTFIDQGY